MAEDKEFRFTPKKGSEFPVETNPEGMTFMGFKNGASKRINFSEMTPLFGVTSEKGTSTTLAVSQYTWTKDSDTKADKVNEEGGEVLYVRIISNEEFLIALVDEADHILLGIRRADASVYIVKDDLTDKLILNIAELRGMIEALQGLINVSSNEEFLFIIPDAENRVLFGIRYDATIYIKEGAIAELAALTSLFKTEENSDYLEIKYDNEGRILGTINKDGTHCPAKLKLPSSTMDDILNQIGGSINIKAIDHSNESKFSVPFPNSLVDIYINAPFETITAKGQTVKGRIEFFFYNGHYANKYCKIGWQGTSSINLDPKNWSIDLFNDEACTDSCEIKIGNWVYRDGLHFKANTVDAFQTRNVNFSRLTEDIYKTRPLNERYPFSVPVDVANPTLENRVNSGAMCHIDGFPARLFFNNNFYSLGSLNLSKHRSNYQMKKSNLNQVLMEMSGRSKIIYPINWTTWEFRNPSLKNMSGGDLQPDEEPENGVTKTNVLNFFEWVKDFCISIQNGRYYVANIDTGISVGDPLNDSHRINSSGKWVIKNTTTAIDYIPTGYTEESLKAHIAARMPSKFWIDHYILNDFIKNPDAISKNTLLSSYDGFNTVYPNNYDMDIVAGIESAQGVYNNLTPSPAGFNAGGEHCQPLSALYYKLFWNEIVLRYKELRALKVLDLERVFKMHEDYSNIIGIDAYKQHFDKWRELPNNRANNVNSDYWSFMYTDITGVASWNSSTNYAIGAKVVVPNASGVVFTAKAANTNQKPILFEYKKHPQVGGFYSGLTHLYEFFKNQITYLDNYYN